jgi:hypothetical protein
VEVILSNGLGRLQLSPRSVPQRLKPRSLWSVLFVTAEAVTYRSCQLPVKLIYRSCRLPAKLEAADQVKYCLCFYCIGGVNALAGV